MFSYIWSLGYYSSKIDNPNNCVIYKGKMPLIWTEHCVECAMPTCYSSCKLYSRRIDKRCIRFNNGISKSNDGNYTYLSFRKWAKLESTLSENFVAIDVNKLNKIESIVHIIENLVRKISNICSWYIPCRIYERLATIFFRKYNTKQSYKITCFYGQIFLLNNEEKHLNIDIVQGKELKLIYKTSKILKKGWNTIYIPIDDIHVSNAIEKKLIRLYFDEDETAEIVVKTLDFISEDVANNIKLEPAKKVKCVAWDLDNTLWEGVIGDDGKDGVKTYEDSLKLIKALDERGIIQTIVSKNTYDVAWEKIKELGIEDYFLYPAINWGNKSQSLINIAKELNINIDTFAVIDDSAFEREEISKTLPQVRVYDVSDKLNLLNRDEFDVPVNDESKKRRLSYLNESKRKNIAANWQGDYDSFLKSCNLEMDIFKPIEEQDKNRCLELISRSNQYNVSGNRYNDDEFKRLLSSKNYNCFAFKVKDRYGNYGIVGFSSFKEEGDSIILTDFVMSCRVAMKKVEKAFLCYLIKNVFNKNIRINAVKTDRNLPLRNVLLSMPFKIINEDNKHIELYSETKENWYDEKIIVVNFISEIK